MLATKSSARQALRLGRCGRQFATAVEAAGFKVSAVDVGQPTSSVTFLIKAGSRYESKPGVAHFLKNFAFKATGKRSALGTVRESELYGGVLSSSLTREHLAYTAEFLRGDEEYFVDVLSALVSSPKFTRWELTESVQPVVESELQVVSNNLLTQALELAHKLAFRTGLGSSIFAPQNAFITSEDVKQFASSTFVKGNIAILGTGIDQGTLTKLVEKNLKTVSTKENPTSSSSKYFGGETRVNFVGSPQTIFVGFGTTGVSPVELAVLASHLSGKASVKWSRGISPLTSAFPEGVSAETVLLPYSDATLFGLLIQSDSGDKLKEAGKAAVDALKAATNGVKSEDLKRAVAKAKFSAASSAENRDGLVATFGPKVLDGKPSPLQDTLSALDKVDESAFSKVVSTLLKINPTYVALGDLNQLPYRDEIGL